MPELRYFDASREQRAAIQQRLREHLNAHPEIRLAYLMGSFLTDRPFRDIDIAVYLEPELLQSVDLLRYCFQLADELERVVRYPVDVHRLNDAPCGFRFEATRGIVLVSRDESFRIDWTVRTWQEYCDFEPHQRQMLQQILEPFREYYARYQETHHTDTVAQK
ncbi:MAG: nucleotidyltransferase [Armatimonadetes bacterium JP3_11]|nr:MAG: nucleotidyltransferase [Armatimonadetes bacterium JP3_11]